MERFLKIEEKKLNFGAGVLEFRRGYNKTYGENLLFI